MMNSRPSIFGFALASALGCASLSANAADIYRREPVGGGGLKDVEPVYAPVNTWTGFYVGANIGWAGDELTVRDLDGFGAGTAQRFRERDDKIFGGGQFGYNIQRGGFVFGVEGDVGWMDLNGSRLEKFTGDNTKVGIDSGLYGDITGRLGYSFGGLLLYGKGGFAFYNGGRTFSTSAPQFASAGDTDTFTGWTAGGGAEYMLSRGWSIKAEYQHFDFGSQDFNVTTAGGDAFRFKEDLRADTAKIGINYHFNNGYEPLK